MIDSKLAGTGNSRFLKSVSNFKTLYPTYDDFVAALIAGTLPIDLNGINPDGWTQQGTPLNKANLLSDDVANGLGLVDDATPNGAFNAIISAKGKSNGFATLDSSGKVPSGQLNLSGSVTSTSTTTAANSAAVKAAYDKASAAGDEIFGSGTILTGTSSSEPSSVTSSSVRYKKINGVTYVRVSAKCNFNNPSGNITLRISLTGLSVQYSDCIIGQLNQFIVGSTIFDNNIKLVMVSNSGDNLVFDIYYENVSIASDKTVSVECSAILTRPT